MANEDQKTVVNNEEALKNWMKTHEWKSGKVYSDSSCKDYVKAINDMSDKFFKEIYPHKNIFNIDNFEEFAAIYSKIKDNPSFTDYNAEAIKWRGGTPSAALGVYKEFLRGDRLENKLLPQGGSMMLFSKARLKEELEQYKRDFSNWFENGKYKWEAVKTFQENWNIDDPDFATMFKNSISKTEDLLIPYVGSKAKDAIISLAETAPEDTRAAFKALFYKDGNVIERIKEFKGNIKKLYDKYKIPNKKYPQNEYTATTFLWLQYPEDYYIYKANIICTLAVKLKHIHSFRRSFKDCYDEFYDLCSTICSYLCKDENFINIVKQHIADEDAYYQDLNHKILTADFISYIKQKDNEDNSYDGYWWIISAPKIWELSKFEIGEVQGYTLNNEDGEPRAIKRNFPNVKLGNKVIGYEATPNKKIVATCEIVGEANGTDIKIKKVEDVIKKNITLAILRTIPELQNMEWFKNPNGSLFKLKESEYNCIMKLIDGTYKYPELPVDDEIPTPPEFEKYTKEEFLHEVFMSENKYEKLVAILERKQNIILKGVPGVGKTFAAKRLAYSIMGEKDNSRIKLIQFHQNYSYEEFMKGYKPSGEGFSLENGVFYEFCKKAAKDAGKPYFFIIDEINRGNISKIFGELLMLIESEYREEKMTLPYKDGQSYEEFSIPKNLYIIGTMNTADRSIAMLDAALRRRFCHFDLEPAFGTKEFQDWLRGHNSNSKKVSSLISRIKKLNKKITKDLGKGFCIGHSYFCKDNLNEEDLNLIVDFEIIPALEQYWFDEPIKVILWAKILHGEKDVSDAYKDDIEDIIKAEVEEEEKKKELEEVIEKDEDSNAGEETVTE